MTHNKVALLLAAAILCGTCGWIGGVDAAVTNQASTTTAKPAATTQKPSTAAPTVTTAKPNATTPHTTQSATTEKEKFVAFPESQCHIPFWHNGVWHHTCVRYNAFGDFWCSLSANFTKDENWRRCRSADLKRFQCHIPFEYEGRNHTECLPLSPESATGRGAHHSFWCGVVPKIHSWTPGSTDWAYCEHQQATGIAYLKSVGVHRSLPEPAAPAGGAAAAAAAAAAPAPRLNHTEAAAGAAVAAKAPVKALTGNGAGGSGGAAAGLSTQATVGISVGVVCSVLAVAAVVAGVAIRKRRRRGSNHTALLQTREKGTYGGVEASD